MITERIFEHVITKMCNRNDTILDVAFNNEGVLDGLVEPKLVHSVICEEH